MPTPVKADRLQHHLQKIGYDEKSTQYLVDGFKNGFSIGSSTPVESITANNSDNVKYNIEIVEKKLQTEIAAGRVLGPFDDPPFTPFHISPLNIRPKKDPNKFRLLHNLSHPYDGRSINATIPEKNKTVKYSSVGDAIQKLVTLPHNTYTAKTDISDAFRLIPIRPDEYPKLGMKFKGKYYFDRNLPQGCGSSCKIFETFSTAVHAIFEAYTPSAICIHMLDDFFVIATDYRTCKDHLNKLLSLCKDLGIPMAPEKTTDPGTNTTFLGVELNTRLRQAKLPLDKLTEYKSNIESAIRSIKVTKTRPRIADWQTQLCSLSSTCTTLPSPND